MAEIEYKGIKVGGSKLLLILPLLGTIGGGLWASFEFYKDYMNMKKQIQRYVAPDLSGFDKRLDVFKQKMISIEDSVTKSTDYTRDIKNDLKKDVARLEKSVDAAERRTKNTADAARTALDQNENKVRSMVTKAEDRFDTRREQLRNDMTSLEGRMKRQMGDLEKATSDKIQKALVNPLAALKK